MAAIKLSVEMPANCLAIQVKDVGILPIASAALIKLLWRNARDLAEFAIQHSGILMTPPGLLIQTSQLRHQNHALPFAEAIVRSVTEVAVKPFSRKTAAIVNRARLRAQMRHRWR